MIKKHYITTAVRDGHVLAITEWMPSEIYNPHIQVFHVHGGAFSSGTDQYGERMCELLCKLRGCRVYGINFRKDNGVQQALDDVVDVVNNLRAAEGKVFLSGGSSGGWFAAMTATNRKCPIDGLLLFCPVLYPKERAWWLEASLMGAPYVVLPRLYTLNYPVAIPSKEKAEIVLGLQKAFFKDSEPPEIPFPLLCKSLMFLGAKDENVPLYQTLRAMPYITTTVVISDAGHRLQEAKDLTETMRQVLSQNILSFVV